MSGGGQRLCIGLIGLMLSTGLAIGQSQMDRARTSDQTVVLGQKRIDEMPSQERAKGQRSTGSHVR